jgi:hypothetical protein
MARTLLLFDGNDRLRRMAFRNLAAHPRIFSRLLDVHVGALRRSALTAIAQPLPRADIEQEARHLPQNGIF